MVSVYYNQKYGFLIVPNAIERFMGCYISIEPTIEIMAEETIDKIGCAIRKGIKIAESSPKVDESQLNNFWKQTKYKSFPTFSKNYQRIDLKQNGDELEIRRWERNNRGGYSRKTEEKDYINFIEMSDYELGLFIKKMFEPCEIRIDETERFETLEGKIISYSIPNEHYKNIGDGHTDSYMTYRNEDYDKLYISFLIGDGTDCTDEVSIKNHYKKIYKQMSNIKFESKCNKKYVHFLTENGEVLLSFIDNGYVEFFMCIPYNIERKVQKESIEQYLKMLFSIKIEDK